MKKFILMALGASCVSLASASELFWQTDFLDTEKKTVTDVSAANLYATLGNANVGAWATKQLQTIDVDDLSGESFYASISSLGTEASTYKFFVELTDSNGKRVNATDLVSYSTLKNSIRGSGMSSPVSAYNFTGYTAEIVPEPTSGLLVLLGAVALGLKRKRV